MANPLKIGATIKDYFVQTTKGDFTLHDFLNGKIDGFPGTWTCLFTHPADFTPVCTSELGTCHNIAPRFAAMNTNMIAISCDSVESHEN